MSPKHSSLAFDEVKAQNETILEEVSFEPELNLVINTRFVGGSSATQLTPIAGRVTVSF